MLDITVIILTYNEELHIRRCLENVNQFASKVYIIDSFSTDSTVAIAKDCGAEVVQNSWPGNQAAQFNWALDKLEIDTEWILRLDADEYLLPELIDELKNKLTQLSLDVTGIEFKRRHIFMDKWMRRGIYPVRLLRLFRKGLGVYENRLMDEHINLLKGNAIVFDNDFCDHNLHNLSYFCHKHVDYAIREAAELLDVEYDLSDKKDSLAMLGEQARKKRLRKIKYLHQPLFVRSFAYFCYRYILKGACLDGKVGFIWTFLQGWWYRTLVDAKVYEIKKACNGDKESIRRYLLETYRIDI